MTINRLQWIDNKVIRIANEFGHEKLIDIEDDFKELEFNTIPLFNEVSGFEWYNGFHIFLSREYEPDNIKYCQRVYQDYKSKYFLLN